MAAPRTIRLAAVSTLLLGTATCADLSQTQQQTLTGSAAGGAAIAAFAGNPGLEALVGGGVGTLAGYLWGVSSQTPHAEQAKAVIAAAGQLMDSGVATTIQAMGSDGQPHRIAFRPAVHGALVTFVGQSPAAVTGYRGRVCGQVRVAVSTMRGQVEDRSVRRIRKGFGLLGGSTWAFV